MSPARKTNIVFFGIDSLRADRLGLYGHPRPISPHLDALGNQGAVFTNVISPHIPTTSGYSNMLTGRDAFGTGIVALRHRGGLPEDVPTLAEILETQGYQTTCVGFEGNPAARGFQKYLGYEAWERDATGYCPKAQNLNDVTLPELRRLASSPKPFFLFLRHMDPHTPYLPPPPFERMFYGGNETDPRNKSMKPVYDFAPFADYFRSWLPPGITDKDYVIAQYDAEVAYMDACIAALLSEISALGLDDNTLIVVDSDHGETLYDHECWFDHHGLYECTLRVPLFFRLPGRIPSGLRFHGPATLMDVTPTILDILGVRPGVRFDGRSLLPEIRGRSRTPTPESYITECTWMRKHGWRTQEWKLIHALEPDFHFKPEVELYNLVEDPGETRNLAHSEKALVACLEDRMQKWIARRVKQTGRPNPILNAPGWHGVRDRDEGFTSSREAYDTLHIGDAKAARKLQARKAKTRKAGK